MSELRTHRRRGAWMVAFGAAALIAPVACSSPTTEGEYTVRFPSASVAIATDTLQIMAFLINDLDGPSKCGDLILKRSQGQPLPTRAAELSTTVCGYLQSDRTFKLDYGTYAFLAVGQRAKTDYLVGCNVQIIGEGSAAVPLDLFPITKNFTEPTTTCPGLPQFCAKSCP